MNEQLPAEKQLVFSIHGINTHAPWQKSDLGRAVSEHDFTYVALDYGKFSFLFFLSPCCRRKMVAWFRDEYTKHTKNATLPPHIIAHSFGTYLVARSMAKYRDIGFDRIILCGSIVEPDFKWNYFFKRGRCTAILNDCGKRDFWSKIVGNVVSDAGQSGVDGFVDTCDGQITQIKNAEFKHSDFFFDLNYRNRWIPFLQGDLISADDGPPSAPKNRRPLILGVGALIVVLLLIGAAYWLWPDKKYESDGISFPQLIEDHRDENFLTHLDKYKTAHEGKEITWQVTIKQKLPDGYIIAPVDPDLADFTVVARWSPDNPVDWLKVGDRVKIRGVIDDINPSTVRLRLLRLVERLKD